MSEFKEKTDCVCYCMMRDGSYCRGLDYMVCKYRECKFYKPGDSYCDYCKHKGSTYCVDCAVKMFKKHKRKG